MRQIYSEESGGYKLISDLQELKMLSSSLDNIAVFK
jgi:hypothetical protein